jgi:murein lipoprotein
VSSYGDAFAASVKVDEPFTGNCFTLVAEPRFKRFYPTLLIDKGELVMIRKEIKTAAALVSVMALAGLAGCASTSEIDSLRSDISRANETAASAAADAAAARKQAAAASATAAEAKATADDAKASADASAEKIDRMFKKSMYK